MAWIQRVLAVVRRSLSFPIQVGLAVLGLVTAYLAWSHVIGRNWPEIALALVTVFWLNTMWELRKETRKATHSDEVIDSEAMYALNISNLRAEFTLSVLDPVQRDYQFVLQVENTASFPIRIELVWAHVSINGHIPDNPYSAWMHQVLHTGRSIDVELPVVRDLTQDDVMYDAHCDGIFKCQRLGDANFTQCEFKLTSTSSDFDFDHWPRQWNTSPVKQVEYGPFE
jgi:hypothetical protein